MKCSGCPAMGSYWRWRKERELSFRDRSEAGARLAGNLADLRGEDVVVLAIPRGGVPVAAPVAEALDASLDVILVRKLGVPSQPELAMGALGEGGVRILNDRVIEQAGITPEQLAEVEDRERAELDRRADRFRGGRPPVPVEGRVVVVVDDGMATGSTARAACRVARARNARRVILGVPVASREAVAVLRDEVEVVSVHIPRSLWAVGYHYRDFAQVPDAEVRRLLDATPPST
jgi:putative phosphoribosyl transferase